MSNLKEIEAIFKGVFPKSKTIARRYVSKGRTKSSTETFSQGENILASKEIIEGTIDAVSPDKMTIKVNDEWYKFSKANWRTSEKDATLGSRCRFESSSSENEYQGKVYTTNWVNNFNPLNDIPDGIDILEDEEFTIEPDGEVVAPPPVNTNTSAKLIKALGMTNRDLQIMVQTAVKEVYSEKYTPDTVEKLAEDLESVVMAMLIALYRLTK